MTISPIEALVRIPGSEIAHQVRIFPGAIASSLFDVLNEDPHFPRELSPSEYRVMTVLPGGVRLAFEAEDDLFSPLPKEDAVLELLTREAPFLGN